MLISKDQFIHFANRYKHCIDEQDKFHTALRPWFGDSGIRYLQKAVDGLEELLVLVSECEDEDGIFSWWVDSNTDKIITVPQQPTGDIAHYDASTAEGLYNYLYDMYHHEY